MNNRDLTVVKGAVKQCESYTCLLTDRPCGLVPVTLRRMMIIPPILWIGWREVVVLPLLKVPALALWQYLRLLRPFIVFFLPIYGRVVFQELLGVNPESPLARALVYVSLGVAIALWFVLGHLLKKFEFVRLLEYGDANRTVTLRFSSEEMAQRALQVMVLPEKVDLDEALEPEQMPSPSKRPIFRYLAGAVAVVFAIAALGIWFGIPEPDAWQGALGCLGIAVFMAVIAVRKT